MYRKQRTYDKKPLVVFENGNLHHHSLGLVSKRPGHDLRNAVVSGSAVES